MLMAQPVGNREQTHPERHLVSPYRLAARRSAGANDGIVSTASLIVGVAAASTPADVLIAGSCRSVAEFCPWQRLWEYVSVSSQADTEHADWGETRKLKTQPALSTKS